MLLIEYMFRGLSEAVEEPLTEKHKRLACILDFVCIEEHVRNQARSLTGRPAHDLKCLAHSFVAKAFYDLPTTFYDLPTTQCLIEMLCTNANLRFLCGWKYQKDIPSSATFSRAFAIIVRGGLGDTVHQALVSALAAVYDDDFVPSVSRDSTQVKIEPKKQLNTTGTAPNGAGARLRLDKRI